MARISLRVRWLIWRFPTRPQSDSPRLRFHEPPCNPGRSDFPSPVLTSARTYFIGNRPSHELTGLSSDAHIPIHLWFTYRLAPANGSAFTRLSVRMPATLLGRRVPRAPSPTWGVTFGGGTKLPLQRELPLLSCYYELMRQSKALFPSSVLPIRKVFAGYHPSLLGLGPSRLYPPNPCTVDWTHTPPGSSEASARFFTEGFGLTLREIRSAPDTIPAWRFLQGATISGLQSFDYLQSSVLARPSNRSYHNASECVEQSGLLHHAISIRLPFMECGITT